MNGNGGEEIIGTTAAARILGVHPATITRWVISGYLPAADRLGGDSGPYLFRRRTVDTLAAARRREALERAAGRA